MPAIILGFIPALISILTGLAGLLFFGFIFTLGATGDSLIINLIRKEPASNWVIDHPSEAGYFILKFSGKSCIS